MMKPSRRRDSLAQLLTERDEAIREVERLTKWVNDLQSGMFINCVYCGHQYGPKDKVPAAMADVLKAHIEKCPKHPMSHLKEALEAEKCRTAAFRDGWAECLREYDQLLTEREASRKLVEAADAYLDSGGIKRDEEERHSPQRAALVRAIGESKLAAPQLKPIPHPDHARCLEVYAERASTIHVLKETLNAALTLYKASRTPQELWEGWIDNFAAKVQKSLEPATPGHSPEGPENSSK